MATSGHTTKAPQRAADEELAADVRAPLDAAITELQSCMNDAASLSMAPAMLIAEAATGGVARETAAPTGACSGRK